MRRLSTLYLAGPDRHYPDSGELLARKRLACLSAGLDAKLAGDGLDLAGHGGELQAREFYAGALASLRAADAVIANLTPWRGPGCDPGVAFELGFASALGKPVLAYMNVEDEDEADYRSRVETWVGAEVDESGVWRDPDGCVIEDYDLPETAMLWAEARRLFVMVTPDPFGDIMGLELCIQALKEWEE